MDERGDSMIEDSELNNNDFDILSESIGSIARGAGGSDQYVLLTRWVDDFTPQDAEDWLLPQVYKDTHQAGGYFCHSVTTMQGESSNKVIAIVHHRYDV